MGKINDGGPAFPLKNYTSEIGPDNCGFMAKDALGKSLWVNSGSPGMSLRDWFAGHVLSLEQDKIVDEKEVAKHCYKMADAMIKERDQDEV